MSTDVAPLGVIGEEMDDIGFGRHGGQRREQQGGEQCEGGFHGDVTHAPAGAQVRSSSETVTGRPKLPQPLTCT